MKEYIKKFADASATNNYAIADIPFMTSVATNPVQNLVCNESGKKLVNTGGVVTVENAGPALISFTTGDTTYQAEEGMTWGEWIESDFNTDDFTIEGGFVHRAGYTRAWLYAPDGGNTDENVLIISNGEYFWGKYAG